MTNKNYNIKPPATTGWIIGTIIFIFVFIGGILLLSWHVGILPIKASDTSKTFAAVLMLTGSLITVSITFVGVLLKLSFDARTFELKRESEERMKLEACVSAINLFSTSSATNVPTEQRAGALFSLVNLGQIETSLVLLGHMWRSNQIDVPPP